MQPSCESVIDEYDLSRLHSVPRTDGTFYSLNSQLAITNFASEPAIPVPEYCRSTLVMRQPANDDPEQSPYGILPPITIDNLSPPMIWQPCDHGTETSAPRISRTRRERYYESYNATLGLSAPQVLHGANPTEVFTVTEDTIFACSPELGSSSLESAGPVLLEDSDAGASHPVSRSSGLPNNHSTKQQEIPTFPKERRPEKRILSEVPQSDIDTWFTKTGVRLGHHLSTDQRNQITRLLFTYQDLNSTNLTYLPPTDLYVHRVRLKSGTLPFNKMKQRRWPPAKEFWLKRIINDGLKHQMYESTIVANGKLSDWNAQAQLVDKTDTPGEWDEPRLTFNYQNVIEDKPGCFVELMSSCHDYMGHPSHQMYHKLDLKHGYWVISVHPDDRHYFAFSIPGLGQLQPTRMPQGSCSASFSFTELMYLVLGYIPKTSNFPGAESLLNASEEHGLPKVAFYIDDMHSGFKTFDEGYAILADELLPRLVWAKLKLSFKKLELFVTEVVALGVMHKSGGIITTKTERCDKIRDFPVPKNATDVRKFIGAIGFTRAGVKNFSEIKIPLSRLTGDVEFVWKAKHQAAFQLLREMCSEAVERHGWDYLNPVRMYCDASLQGAGCLITQMRIGPGGTLMEVPIIYDAFTFTKPQRTYGVYKKELCAITEFSRKFEHMLRAPKTSVILTDHKPLVFFLKSSVLDGIYARWAAELRVLNAEICWIPGSRNVVADALSRTIFPESESGTPPLEEFGELVMEEGEPLWIWKDGKGGYAELLKKVGEPIQEAELRKLFAVPESEDHRTTNSSALSVQLGHLEDWLPAPVSSLLHGATEDTDWKSHSQLVANLSEYGTSIPPHSRFVQSEWYSDVATYLRTGAYPRTCITKVHNAAFLRKAGSYKATDNGDLHVRIRDVWKRCLTQSEISQVLMLAHDQGGHFGWSLTLRKLRQYYWPGMSKDVKDYILGCLTCRKHGTAVRSQTMARVSVTAPMELLGVDFVGPFPKLGGTGKFWILVVVDYFTRFVWAKATVTDDSETVIAFLDEIFHSFGVPVGAYVDPGSHFGEKVGIWAQSRGVVWCHSPVAAKKAVGMIEKVNDILQRVLKKITPDPSHWPEYVPRAVFEVNKREIAHLHYSPAQIMLGFDPASVLETAFPTADRQSLSAALKSGIELAFPEDDIHSDLVMEFMLKRQEIRKSVHKNSDYHKDLSAQRHDLGIRAPQEYSPGDLVMLYDHKEAGKKLRPAWRGPFVVSGFGGDLGKSYTLRQINGDAIPRHYYGDSLQRFRLREGYLITNYEEAIPVYQNIRLGKAAFKLPRNLRTMPGVRVPNDSLVEVRTCTLAVWNSGFCGHVYEDILTEREQDLFGGLCVRECL